MPLTIRPYRRLHCAILASVKRLLLITLLLLSNGPVYAEWVLVSGNDQTGVAVYLDPDTIRRKGDIVRMLILDDYKTVRTVEGISYFSAKRETLFDCAEERTRLLAFAEFSGNMGNGEVVYDNSDGDRWIPVESDSINKRLWEVACAKK